MLALGIFLAHLTWRTSYVGYVYIWKGIAVAFVRLCLVLFFLRLCNIWSFMQQYILAT